MLKKSISLKLALCLSLGFIGNEVMAQDVIMTIAGTDYKVTVDENTQAGKLFLNSMPLTLVLRISDQMNVLLIFPNGLAWIVMTVICQ